MLNEPSLCPLELTHHSYTVKFSFPFHPLHSIPAKKTIAFTFSVGYNIKKRYYSIEIEVLVVHVVLNIGRDVTVAKRSPLKIGWWWKILNAIKRYRTYIGYA